MDSRNLRLPGAVQGLVLLALVGCACAADTPVPASARLMETVKTLIGDAPCEKTEQCRVIAIGAKACGGPSSYLAWSVQHTDEAALQAAVQSQAQAQRQESRSSGRVSDCRMLSAPAVTCQPAAAGDGRAEQKTCQLSQGGLD